VRITFFWILLGAALVFLIGCASSPADVAYRESMHNLDKSIYAQSKAIVATADRRNYANPATRPYVDSGLIDSHYQAIDQAEATYQSAKTWDDGK
jgi:hypothetical protein